MRSSSRSSGRSRSGRRRLTKSRRQSLRCRGRKRRRFVPRSSTTARSRDASRQRAHTISSYLPKSFLCCLEATGAHRRLLWEQLSRAHREAIQPLCNSAVFSRQFIVLSVESSPSVSASRKPVMSPSYSHSAAFAALALCNPYSEVPPTRRTRGAGRLFALIRDGTSLSVGPGQSPAGRFKRLLAAGHGAFSAALRAGRHCRSAW
jgi:hypothetical protein